MHEHEWKNVFKKGPWAKSPRPELLMAYELKVRKCVCGEEQKIKSAPKGIWWKGENIQITRIKTYPERWKKGLKDSLRETLDGTKTLSLETLANRSELLWSEVEELSQSLLLDGVAERFEKYPNKSPRDVKIVIPAENLQLIRELLGLTKKEADAVEIDSLFEIFEKERFPEGHAVAQVVDQMARLWQETRKPTLLLQGETTVTLKSLVNYKLILVTLLEIAKRDPSRQGIYFRELSAKITGDSKGLYVIRSYLRGMFGDLKYLGVIEHAPLLFCRAPVAGEMNGCHLDLWAAADYAVMTESTASTFKPTQSHCRSLLLIENQTTFEAVASRLPAGAGAIFLAGYPPGHVQTFIKRILKFKPIPGKLWCDIDPDGIEIALMAGKYFEEVGQKWEPHGMSKEWLLDAPISKPLDDRDREKLKVLKTRSDAKVFYPLIDEMEKIGRKVEQEVIDQEKLQF
ncbi:MAG: hypothetical protein HY202_00775 [Nitrospirae bacterium]|nr:hypothetical protein [Nitrospirota bacterium]